MAVLRDMQLDADGDLDLSDGRSFAWVADASAVAQHAKFRLQQVKGEWVLNLDAGLDWFGEVLGLNHSDSQVEAEIRRVLQATPGVGSVDQVAIVRGPEARAIRVTVQGTTDLGQLFNTTIQVG